MSAPLNPKSGLLPALLASCLWGWGPMALAQGDGTSEETADENSTVDTAAFKTRTVLSDNFLVSPRAAAMGGAVTAVADDIDALHYNPAGIGGFGKESKARPFSRKVYFPHLGATANENAKDLNSEFRLQNAQEDNTVGKAIVDAAAGKRQYGRGSVALGLTFGRSALVPFYDNQVAAVSQGVDGAVDFRNRSLSGAAYGVSFMDVDGKIALGYSGWYASGSETKGALSYGELLDPTLRKEGIKDGRRQFSLLAHNVGGNIRLGKRASPTLSLVLRHIGDTKFEFSDDDEDSPTEDSSSPDEETDADQFPQDLTLGFSLAPMTKVGRFVWTLEATRLTESGTALYKKIRSGFEWSLGKGRDSYSVFSLRAGYNNAGSSYGVFLNLGLIGFEVSSEAVNIGRGNERFIERRQSATFIVNAAAM